MTARAARRNHDGASQFCDKGPGAGTWRTFFWPCHAGVGTRSRPSFLSLLEICRAPKERSLSPGPWPFKSPGSSNVSTRAAGPKRTFIGPGPWPFDNLFYLRNDRDFTRLYVFIHADGRPPRPRPSHPHLHPSSVAELELSSLSKRSNSAIIRDISSLMLRTSASAAFASSVARGGRRLTSALTF